VETSLDGLTWTEVDRQTDRAPKDQRRSAFGSGSPKLLFPISSDDECRFIRLTQTGKNADGNDALSIECFEVFGKLFVPQY
jgi:hypothetical protein